MEMKLEVVVIPVSDVDRAKQFYTRLGWSPDIDYSSGDDYRIVQFTPPGSGCSIMFGTGITTAEPGSLQGLHLIVSDVVAVRDRLVAEGIDVGELFHDDGGIFHHIDAGKIADGPNPDRKSYASYASFTDPDGNGWVFQEVTARLSADLQAGDIRFAKPLVDWLTAA